MAIKIHVIECASPPTAPPTELGQHWVDTLNKQTYLSVGTSSISDWFLVTQGDPKITVNIPAGNTVDLDTIPISSLCTVKYIICVFNATQEKWKSFELLGSKKTLTSVEDTIHSVLGEILDVDFDFIVSGTDAKLVGTNNEAFDVTVKIHKNLL